MAQGLSQRNANRKHNLNERNNLCNIINNALI